MEGGSAKTHIYYTKNALSSHFNAWEWVRGVAICWSWWFSHRDGYEDYQEFLDEEGEEKYVRPVTRSRAETQQVSKMLYHANVLMDEHFNVSMVEKSKMKDKGILLYPFQVAHSVLGALIGTKRSLLFNTYMMEKVPNVLKTQKIFSLQTSFHCTTWQLPQVWGKMFTQVNSFSNVHIYDIMSSTDVKCFSADCNTLRYTCYDLF